MGLFDNLSKERKIMILNQTQEGLIAEVIPMLLRNGIDPTLLDTADPAILIDGFDLMDEARIYKICEGLELIKQKLADLS